MQPLLKLPNVQAAVKTSLYAQRLEFAGPNPQRIQPKNDGCFSRNRCQFVTHLEKAETTEADGETDRNLPGKPHD